MHKVIFMKKIFLIVFALFFQLGANSLQPIQPSPSDTPPSVPYYLTPAYIEEESKKPNFYIRHGEDSNWFYGKVHNFYDEKIFFDRDISGKPIYKKISEHAADNPKFGKVLLVLYYHKKKYKNQFVIMGTYSNQVALKKFLRKMQTLFGYSRGAATWCPKQNALIFRAIDIKVDSTGHSTDISFDSEIGKKFEQWLTLKNNYK